MRKFVMNKTNASLAFAVMHLFDGSYKQFEDSDEIDNPNLMFHINPIIEYWSTATPDQVEIMMSNAYMKKALDNCDNNEPIVHPKYF